MPAARFVTTLSLGALLVASASGCGGGGGGGSADSGFYAGSWSLSLGRAVNDCGLGLPVTFTNTVLVNQNGSEVVVDSGRVVLTGSTHEEDGFFVARVEAGANGCETATGYRFEDASDGEADVVLAIVSRCGRGECAVAYGGSGRRVSSRSAAGLSGEGTSELPQIQGLVVEGAEGGREVSGEVPVEERVELLLRGTVSVP